MRSFSLIYVLLCVIIYVFFPDVVIWDQNKIDTLYMVSTIFFSSTLGMIISNNVNLNYQRNKGRIRHFNKKMTFIIVGCFSIETISYFFYNESFSHIYGIHIHLIVLFIIIYTTIVYMFSIPKISRAIAVIEDDDYKEKDAEIESSKYKKIRQNVSRYCEEPRTREDIQTCFQLNDEDFESVILTFVGAQSLIQIAEEKFCVPIYIKNKIRELCSVRGYPFADLLNELNIEEDVLIQLLKDLLKSKSIIKLDDGYNVYNEGTLRIYMSNYCRKESKTRYQILNHIGLSSTPDNFKLYIQPLINDGLIERESGTGFGIKYIAK